MTVSGTEPGESNDEQPQNIMEDDANVQVDSNEPSKNNADVILKEPVILLIIYVFHY